MKNMVKLLHSKALTAVPLLLFAAALLTAPQKAAEGAREGLLLCFNTVIPALFPFFVFSSLIVDLGFAARLGRALEGVMRPLFRLGGSCAAALALGLIGGYPVGARTTLQLYRQGQCSKTEAERLLAFCNNSGPAFILGVAGVGIFGDKRVGLLLWLTHVLSAVSVGILFRFYGRADRIGTPHRAKPITALTLPSAFTAAVTHALQSILNVCAFAVFFSVVLNLLSVLEGWPFLYRLASGLLELSSGISSLSGEADFMRSVSMAAFMLGWAGLSIHCQVLSLLADSGLSVKPYLLGKLCHGVIAAALTRILARFLPIGEAVQTAAAGAALPSAVPLVIFLTAIPVICLPYVKKSVEKRRRIMYTNLTKDK